MVIRISDSGARRPHAHLTVSLSVTPRATSPRAHPCPPVRRPRTPRGTWIATCMARRSRRLTSSAAGPTGTGRTSTQHLTPSVTAVRRHPLLQMCSCPGTAERQRRRRCTRTRTPPIRETRFQLSGTVAPRGSASDGSARLSRPLEGSTPVLAIGAPP